jgi:integrase
MLVYPLYFLTKNEQRPRISTRSPCASASAIISKNWKSSVLPHSPGIHFEWPRPDILFREQAGPYRLHDLRHTFNTNMTKAGVDQVVVMKLTGHKTNAMFLRYSHIDQEQSERAMKKLNGFLLQKNGDEKKAVSK